MNVPSEMTTIRMQKRIRKKKAEIFFPDDIIINILSRLPAKNALRCQLVCRRWRDLTSTHSFIQLHMRRSTPMIVALRLQRSGRGRRTIPSVDNFLLDKWWECKRRTSGTHRFVVDSEEPRRYNENIYRVKFSHGGLVVFASLHVPFLDLQSPPFLEERWNGELIILNPIREKNVKIKLSRELWNGEIHGVFFHPLLQEYCTLWRLCYAKTPAMYDPKQGYYKMLNLGSKPCWRDITNLWNHRVKVKETCPVLIGEYLYWLVKPEQENVSSGRGDIMEFDIRSENFVLMHCPVPLDVSCTASKINLLDIDGVLSFVLTSGKKNKVTVSIWKLKDGAKQLWIHMRHSIRINGCSRSAISRAIAVEGENLLLLLDERLYICNLSLGTASEKKKYNNSMVTCSHVMSLASLENCKSEIYMDKEGEVGAESDVAKSLVKGAQEQIA